MMNSESSNYWLGISFHCKAPMSIGDGNRHYSIYYLHLQVSNINEYYCVLYQTKWKVKWLAFVVTMGDRLSISSTMTRFFSSLGEKRNVSPSSSGLALLKVRSPSSSPRWAIWYKWLEKENAIKEEKDEWNDFSYSKLKN